MGCISFLRLALALKSVTLYYCTLPGILELFETDPSDPLGAAYPIKLLAVLAAQSNSVDLIFEGSLFGELEKIHFKRSLRK